MPFLSSFCCCFFHIFGRILLVPVSTVYYSKTCIFFPLKSRSSIYLFLVACTNGLASFYCLPTLKPLFPKFVFFLHILFVLFSLFLCMHSLLQVYSLAPKCKSHCKQMIKVTKLLQLSFSPLFSQIYPFSQSTQYHSSSKGSSQLYQEVQDASRNERERERILLFKQEVLYTTEATISIVSSTLVQQIQPCSCSWIRLAL